MTELRTHALIIGYKHRRLTNPLNLMLNAGELVCLIGTNGTGKSTLLRTLAGLQRPLSGSVTIAGEDIHQLAPTRRARHLSVVLTTRPAAPLLTGYELTALGRHPHTDWRGHLTPVDAQAVQTAIHAVGAQEYATLPLSSLSDGQQQKLMIARAVAQEAPVMLLDEPTAFLDLPRRVEIIQLLRQIARQYRRAVLLSTHDLDVALRTADRVWLLADAHIHDGAPEDLVLSGAFEQAFRGQGVAFNTATGSFCFGEPAAKAIALMGEGAARDWTQRALERVGYSLSADAPVRVHVVPTREGMRWQLWQGEQCSESASLYALVSELRAY
jgi:iron complex transport system ATP-binding protein